MENPLDIKIKELKDILCQRPNSKGYFCGICINCKEIEDWSEEAQKIMNEKVKKLKEEDLFCWACKSQEEDCNCLEPNLVIHWNVLNKHFGGLADE